MKLTYLLRAVWLAACACILLALAQAGLAGPRPQALLVALQPIISGLQRPVVFTHANDSSGRMFIVEQAGLIKIYNGSQVLPTPFLNLTSIVKSTGNEQGLLGLAFHPDYATNGYFYVNYTSQNGAVGDTVIARYSRSPSNPNLADPAAATILLTIAQPEENHNGGNMRFGPDGYLYIGMGDGGGGGDQHGSIGNAQNLSTLLGKMLRIDVNNTNTADGLAYDIPPNNPFANDNDPNTRAEIWSYGLRNPWRFSFDRQTGDLFIGDVGQNMREEVDFQPASSSGGENYGWRCREGDLAYDMSTSNCGTASFTAPILTYPTSHSPCGAVTGGYRYRGSAFPQLSGVYLYADYCTGQIWGATQSGNSWSSSLLRDSTASISSFGEDQSGELYLADLSAGMIYRIVSGNLLPTYLPLVRQGQLL